MTPKNFDLHLYANIMHSEEPTADLKRAYGTSGRLETVVDAIETYDIPTTISMQGFDIAYLRNTNAKLLSRLAKSKQIRFVTTPYSHVLLSTCANQDNQTKLTRQEFNRGVGIKQTPLYMGPEFDITPDLIGHMKSLDARAVLLQEDANVNQLYGFRPEFYEQKPGIFAPANLDNADAIILQNEDGQQIYGVMTLSNAEFRAPFLNMLRGITTPQETITAHIAGLNRTKLPVGIGLIDAEAIYGCINVSKQNNPVYRFVKYLAALSNARQSEQLIMTPFDISGTYGLLDAHLHEQVLTLPVIDHINRPKAKWLQHLEEGFSYGKNIDYRTRQLACTKLTEREQRLIEIARVSDLKSAFFGLKRPDKVLARLPVRANDGTLINKDQPGAVVIRSDFERPAQIEHIVRCLEQNIALTKSTQVSLLQASQEFMQVIDQITK